MKRSFDIPEELRKKLGEHIRTIREKRGLGLNQAAIKAGINIADLHKIENATKNKVNPYQLKAIGEALKLDYKELYKIVGYLDEQDFEYKVLEENNNLSKNNIKGNHGNVNLGKIIKSNIGNNEDILLNDLTDNEKEQVRNFINFLKSQKK